MLNLFFRTGFPQRYMGQHKLYVFEIILNDGTTCHAVVSGIGHDEEVEWADPKTRATISTATVLGWRETYNCDAARQDIDIYFKNPASIVGKDYVSDAFARHIDRESCESCRGYYEAKCKSAVSTATG